MKLWWTPCPRGLRQCLKIMMATKNIDTLGPIWTFSLSGMLTIVASGLDINGCVLSYFEGTATLHCYTSCALTTLHCRKVSFVQGCHMKRYKTKSSGVYSLLWDTVFIIIFVIYLYFIKRVPCKVIVIFEGLFQIRPFFMSFATEIVKSSHD